MEKTSQPKNNFAFILKAFGIALAALLTFIALFKVFQNPDVYSRTLSKISHNYERTGTWNDYQITDVEKPYVAVTNDNLLNWDAGIYNCIRERMYSQEKEKCYHLVRPAFFPLFPLVWKFSTLDAIGVSVLNYFIFAFSLLWLVDLLIEDKSQRLYYFTFGLLMPSVIIFGIPYSEAIFFLAMTAVVAGWIKKSYILYFVGMLAVAASRPAAAFIPLAMGLTALLFILSRKIQLKQAVKDVFLLGFPYAIGLLLVMFLQYIYTGNWFALLDAQQYWNIKLGLPEKISDWSIEGFGLSVFALFFVIVPTFYFIIKFLFDSLKQENQQIKLWGANSGEIKNTLFLVAVNYCIIMFFYTLLLRGGSLHSFFRFILASPTLYILLFLLPEKIRHISTSKKMLWFGGLLVSVILFLVLVEYGGPRFKFSFFGLYLFIGFAALYLFGNKVSTSLRNFSLLGLGFFSILWATYLFNMLLTNAWIFT